MTKSEEPVELTIIDFRSLFAVAFDVQLALLSAEQAGVVVKFTTELTAMRLVDMVTQRKIEVLTSRVFENAEVRDFVLGIDSRFFLSTNDIDGNETMRLARLLSNLFFYGFREPDKSIVPKESKQLFGSYKKDQPQLLELLSNDRWYMVLILLYLLLTESVAVDAAERKKAAGNTPQQPRRTNG